MSNLTSTTMQAQNMISRKFPSMSTASKKYTLLKSVKRMALKYWRRVLRTTLKITAKKEKDYWRNCNTGFKGKLYRIFSLYAISQYLGFLYERNDSDYKHRVDYTFKLTGLEIIGRDNTNLTLQSG